MAFEGLTAEPDGDGRWLVVETGRPRGEAVVATVVRRGEGVELEDPADGPAAPPRGPYSDVDAALEAFGQWRLSRFEGRRP
ncbi:hypothetical protein QDR37_03030 [Amnibacterium sp. CER49]|uniref:hypothetical protein n=1 Tax=Amnibacterium sp. CER49 TaxID=3039161 RepID=UPI00244BF50D|nr:hypothetical protein [Amnibacterium sp. CER49]MDH2442912.1 hypothetical protein [Amnibacterium sp. CER49]